MHFFFQLITPFTWRWWGWPRVFVDALPGVQPLAGQVLVHTVSHPGAANLPASSVASSCRENNTQQVPPPPTRRQLPYSYPPEPFCVPVTLSPSFSSPSKPKSLPPLFFFTTTAMAASEEVRYGAIRRNTWPAPTQSRHLLGRCNSREQRSVHVQNWWMDPVMVCYLNFTLRLHVSSKYAKFNFQFLVKNARWYLGGHGNNWENGQQ